MFLVMTAVLFFQATVALGASPTQKEWTFLIYLNGNNNLDSFGTFNLKEMEKVGSTNDVNVVVQWASQAVTKTKRLLVQKSTDASQVTSPSVEELPRVDMGDYQTLIDFVRWGVQNYPAKHYFIDVWNHGNGWHRSLKQTIRDISYDEISGNSITTQQLGLALADAAKVMGHKVDVYGSDACLMAMAEVAEEVADSVQVFAGSEEVEPGDGWPYDAVLTRWTANPTASASDVAKILVEEYVKSYQGGEHGTSEVTFSAFDLSKFSAFDSVFKDLATTVKGLNSADHKKVLATAKKSQRFYLRDYVDASDFLTNLGKEGITEITSDKIAALQTALSNLIIENQVTTSFTKAKGISMWIPPSKSTYSQYSDKYQALKFQANTGWGSALQTLY
jgi:Clostripain family